MTSLDVDQLEPEETQLKIPTDPTEPATHGNMRKDPNLTGSLQRTLADHGSFTRYLAKLAKSMFTHQEPYLDAEENVPFDPGILGEPPGDISATLGNFPLLMAAHVNFIRRLLMAFQGPTEADQDLLHSKGNLPYLPELKGNLTEVTSGITKEMTANFQDPDPTLNRPRPTFRSPTRSYYGVTLENSPLTTTYHYLPPLPPSSLHHITHNGYKILAPTLSLFHFVTINYESSHLQESLLLINAPRITPPIKPQRLYFYSLFN